MPRWSAGRSDIDRPDRRRFASVDLWALPLLAVFLAGLEVLLKEAPERGWSSTPMLLLAALCATSGIALLTPFIAPSERR